MSKALNNALNFFSGFVTITGASILFGLPIKAQVNPNPSIFNEYPYSRSDVAQTTPDNSQTGDTPYTTPTDESNTNEITPGAQPVQDTTTPTTNPDVQNNNNINNTDDTNTNNNNNGVRALW